MNLSEDYKIINVNGKLMDLSQPRVMGILNITPDSFYAESRSETNEVITSHVQQMLDEGADMIDIGACSSRSGADDVSSQEEMKRLRHGLALLRNVSPDIIVSVDTFRADVAKMCVEEYGVAMINDISAGELDGQMFKTIRELGVPYIMMHMPGTPRTMQQHTQYENMQKEIFLYFAEKIDRLQMMGAKDLIIDPGFGFGKTLEQNYEMLSWMDNLQLLHLPILVGVSRKSMIYQVLECTPQDALNGTTVINTIALTKGADILRVHDVRAAKEAVKLFGGFRKYQSINI